MTAIIALLLVLINSGMGNGERLMMVGAGILAATLAICHKLAKVNLFITETERNQVVVTHLESTVMSGTVAFTIVMITVGGILRNDWNSMTASVRNIPPELLPAFTAACIFIIMFRMAVDFIGKSFCYCVCGVVYQWPN